MSQDDIDASKAPLIDHLIELRGRLIKSLIAIAIAFVVCFYFASDIFNILVVPYERAAGATKTIELIYTAPPPPPPSSRVATSAAPSCRSWSPRRSCS